MDTEHNEFEQVQRLLALKRHEQPPPRYFQEFSSKVIARLQALEAARQVTWRQRLGLDFDFKPALMGAVGVVVCGLLLVGVLSSMGSSQPSNNGPVFAGDPTLLFAAPTVAPVVADGMGLNATVSPPEEIPASTVPVSESTSPFGQLTPLHAERAGFRFGSGN